MGRISMFVGLLLLGGSAQAALEQVSISFSHPDELTDMQVGANRGEDVRERFAQAVERYFLSVGASAQQGHTLELEFHDVDMAGEVQPWRSPEGRPIRYVETGYPARLSFSYRLVDASGQELESGEASVREIPFNLTSARLRDRPFAYELEALRGWWRNRR